MLQTETEFADEDGGPRQKCPFPSFRRGNGNLSQLAQVHLQHRHELTRDSDRKPSMLCISTKSSNKSQKLVEKSFIRNKYAIAKMGLKMLRSES